MSVNIGPAEGVQIQGPRPTAAVNRCQLNTSISAKSNSPEASSEQQERAAATVAPLRALLLLCGAVAACVLAAWVWMLERQAGEFVLVDAASKLVVAALPKVFVLAVVGMLGLGAAGVLWALLKDQRLRGAIAWCRDWARSHKLIALLLLAVIVIGSFDFYELSVDAEARRYANEPGRDPNGGIGMRLYMLREDVRVWLLFGATIMLALAISAMSGSDAKLAARARGWRASMVTSRRRWLALAAVVPIVLGSLMAKCALQGVPHFSDSLTYQMQGRMLMNGQLYMDKPAHPELWINSLFFVTDKQHKDESGAFHYEGTRFFGKYPIGWPAVLGLFDAVGLGFMANAVLVGLGALLTAGLARQVTNKRNATLAAVLYGLSPWVWFNGAHFASHVASMLAVNGFLWMFLWACASVERGGTFGASAKRGLGAGLFLGAAVLVRPFDAAMFAMPAIAYCGWMVLRNPKIWLPIGTVIGLGAMVGVGIYAWTNYVCTGNAKVSPYALEGRWNLDWEHNPVLAAGRVLFQWVELNGRVTGFGVGAMTVAVMGLIVAVRQGRLKRPRLRRGLLILLAANALFFGGAAFFLFTNVWWGPRWLMPMTPLLAILAAELVAVVLKGQGPGAKVQGAESNPQSAIRNPQSPAPLAFAILLAGLCVGLAGEYVGKWYQHRLAPPHNVSAGAHDRAVAMGLSNAIVAVTLEGGNRPPLDPRAGMVFMKAPLEENPVIYVRRIDGWATKAAASYPGRQLYELIADKDADEGFVIVSYEP